MPTYHYQDPNAPTPTEIHIGTAIAISYDNRILFDHRRDGMWGLIGGALELGESLEQCARREVDEETGLKVGKLQLLGSFSNPSRIIERPGVAVQSITICFSAESNSDSYTLSDESREARFCSLDDIVELPIVPTHSMIIPYLFDSKRWPVIA